jgi:arylsulfatase A-like enzyme/tetratricopeptide (TPR) repeat protein
MANVQPSSGRPFKRRAVAIAVISLVVLVAGAFAARSLFKGQVRTAAGTDLGPLPSGVTRDRLNLVVITLDTTRADRIGAYGYKDTETPAFDRLANEGVLFEQAVSVAPLTLPAHSSMFTGKFPPEHGVRDNGGFFLGAEQLTLAEVLKSKGYRTGGFVGAYVLDSKWGIDQGFDTYFDDFEVGDARRSTFSTQRPGNEVVDKALPWVREHKGEPFFAWVHLYDAHSPHRAPEPVEGRYKDHPYNGEITFADTQMARVLAELDTLKLADNTVVMVMGDHGESLGDHGEAGHGFFVYNSVTHVPFAIRAPFGLAKGRKVVDPVRSVDVMPTALDLLGIAPPSGISGVSLAPLMAGTPELGLDAYSEAMYPLHHYGWSDLRALRAGRYKVIDAPRPELYDIDTDPNEATNLFESRKALGDRMIAQLRALEGGLKKTEAALPAGDVDPEARERLAALGYVGSFVASANDPRTERADPKDKIGLFNKLGEANEIAKEASPGPEASASFEKVLSLLDDVVREDPSVIDAWFMMGTQHLAHGSLEKAVEYFKKTLALKPDNDLAVFNLAQAYRRMGNDDAALAGFEHYLTLDPKDPFVLYQMGEIWLDRKDLPRAEGLFRKALEIDPQVVAAKNALGVISLQRGDQAGAERLIREALAVKADLRLGHFNLALLAEQRGDLRAAEREYYEELKAHPDNYKAAFNMSRLYEQVGDREGQIGALKQSIESNPRFAEGYIFLAKTYLDTETNLEEAMRLARQGLKYGPQSEYAPLAHYVMADIFNRQGRPREAARELGIGKALEAAPRSSRRTSTK